MKAAPAVKEGFRSRRPSWSPEQDRVLRRLGTVVGVDELVRRLAEVGEPHSKSAVYSHASRKLISVRPKLRRRRPEPRWHRFEWTADQEAHLRALAGTMRAPELTDCLNRRFGTQRAEGSVRKRARELGISLRPKGRLGMLDMVTIFPIGLKTVPRLVADGLLKARAIGNGTKGSEWWFDVADVEAFVREHPYLYDWRRVRAGRWRDLARLAHLRRPYLTTSQAADRLGLRRLLVGKWCREGLVPGVVRRSGGVTAGYAMPLGSLVVVEQLARERGVLADHRRAS